MSGVFLFKNARLRWILILCGEAYGDHRNLINLIKFNLKKRARNVSYEQIVEGVSYIILI